MNIASYRPEFSAFFSGALVMIFEILGARIIAPYIGNSIYVWTSIIAVVLLALALGYFYGGRLADKGANLKTISWFFCISGVLFLLLPFIKEPVLLSISQVIDNVQLASVVLSLILLTPQSFFLGAIAPIATKVQIQDLTSSGTVIGRVGSLGTVGSIIGTLLAGFVLIPSFGVTNLLIFLSVISIILSMICAFKPYLTINIVFLLLAGMSFIYADIIAETMADNGIVIIETPYSHVTVKDEIYNDREARRLYVDNISHAGMYIGSTDIIHQYLKYYNLFEVFLQNTKSDNILMFGGAAYGYPKHFLETYPDKTLEVIEIDEKITEIAREYFDLEDDPNLRITHADARQFLNTNTKTYDAILGDAFGSYFSVPYQLTTIEAIQQKYDMLSDDGVVILNIIGSLEGPKSRFIISEYASYSEIFPEVFLLPVQTTLPEETQNIMLVAVKNPKNVNYETDNVSFADFLRYRVDPVVAENTPILTDDYAPVDSMISELTK